MKPIVRFCLITFLLVPLFASAQSSREAEHARKQKEKSKHLHPYVPGRAERTVVGLENRGVLQPPVGFYPFIGSVYPGGGLAGGPGYRKPFSDTGVLNVFGAYSIKSYKGATFYLKLPHYANGHLVTEVLGGFTDAPQVAFYGLGNDSLKDNRTNFLYRPIFFGVTETVRPAYWLAFGGGIDDFMIDTKSGKGTFPSIEERFNARTAPGLGADPDYTRGRLFAQVDWRQTPGYTTTGGFYRIDWANFDQRNQGPFSFRRIDTEIDQYIPILRANWIIALRAAVSLTDVDAGNEVPHFLLPKLGGGRELRGYPDFRFQDRNSILLSAEYRWTPSKFLDMVIFYEKGKVAPRHSDIDFSGLRYSYGIGARFHTPAATALRVELARSVEGTRLILGFGIVY